MELIAGTLKLDDERVGLLLEKLGADRFFAALQHAPALRAAIELRVLGSTPPSPRSQSATRTPRISCAGGSGLANLRSRYTPLGNSMWGVAKPMSISKSFAPCPDARRPISSPPAPGSERESHANQRCRTARMAGRPRRARAIRYRSARRLGRRVARPKNVREQATWLERTGSALRCRRSRIQAGSNVTVTPLGSGVDGVRQQAGAALLRAPQSRSLAHARHPARFRRR